MQFLMFGIYSGTRLIRTPSGQKKCSYYPGVPLNRVGQLTSPKRDSLFRLQNRVSRTKWGNFKVCSAYHSINTKHINVFRHLKLFSLAELCRDFFVLHSTTTALTSDESALKV